VAASRDPPGDLADLLRRLAGTVDHFGKSLAQRSVVVDRRERQRFDRLEREQLDRACHIERTVRNVCQQVANVLASHALIPRRSPTRPTAPALADSARPSAPYRSRKARYSAKIPSTSPSEFTACRRLRSSADAGSPLTYHPRCFRNSIAAPRRSGSYASAMCAWSSATANRCSTLGSARIGRPSSRSRV